MKHGTRSRYINGGCRCDKCRDANNEYARQANLLRAERPVPPHAHGWNGYCNYACRCDICKEAARHYNRMRYLLRKARENHEQRQS